MVVCVGFLYIFVFNMLNDLSKRLEKERLATDVILNSIVLLSCKIVIEITSPNFWIWLKITFSSKSFMSILPGDYEHEHQTFVYNKNFRINRSFCTKKNETKSIFESSGSIS